MDNPFKLGDKVYPVRPVEVKDHPGTVTALECGGINSVEVTWDEDGYSQPWPFADLALCEDQEPVATEKVKVFGVVPDVKPKTST